MYEHEDVFEDDAKKFADEIGAIYQKTSAKEQNGVEELFIKIGKKFLNLKSGGSEKKLNDALIKNKNLEDEDKKLKNIINKNDISKMNEINTIKDEVNRYKLENEALKIENKKLKDKMHHKKRNSVKKIEENTEGSNNLGYNKKYVLHMKEEGDNKIEKENTITNNIESNEDNDNENESEDYSETDTEISELKNELETARIELNQLSNECKNLENKIKILREASSNLLIKMNIPNKYKEEIKTILKLFEFTDSEIVFIVDKKKQY